MCLQTIFYIIYNLTFQWVKVQNFQKIQSLKLAGCQQKQIISSLNDELCLENLNINQRSYYYLSNSGF